MVTNVSNRKFHHFNFVQLDYIQHDIRTVKQSQPHTLFVHNTWTTLQFESSMRIE